MEVQRCIHLAALIPLLFLMAPGLSEAINLTTSEQALAVSRDESVPVAAWLDDILVGQTPIIPVDGLNGPGYYQYEVQSFCLAHGKRGPREGDAYHLGKLDGTRGSILKQILVRQANNTDIAQSDIQSLIWAVESMTPFSQLPAPLQAASRRLLDPMEIALLEVREPSSVTAQSAASSLLGLLGSTARIPQPVAEALESARQMRAVLTDPNASFAQIEAVAVPTDSRLGALPQPTGQTNGPQGTWFYTRDGFYQRIFPLSYSRTRIEHVFAQPWDVWPGADGWPAAIVSTSVGVLVNYAGNPKDAARQLASIMIVGAKPGETLILPIDRYVFDSNLTANELNSTCVAGGPEVLECADQLAWSRRFYSRLAAYRKAKGLPGAVGAQPAVVRTLDLARALYLALDGRQLPQWASKLRAVLVNEQAAVACRLASDCAQTALAGIAHGNARPRMIQAVYSNADEPGGSADGGTGSAAPDPSGAVAVPEDNKKQPLGLGIPFEPGNNPATPKGGESSAPANASSGNGTGSPRHAPRFGKDSADMFEMNKAIQTHLH